MNPDARVTIPTLPVLAWLCLLDAVLAGAIAVRYGYSPLTYLEAGGGVLLLLLLLAFLLNRARHAFAPERAAPLRLGIQAGLTGGLFWAVEISINNFLAPPLPARDIIDDAFWALIALLILAASIRAAQRQARITAGIQTGFWSGLSSGLGACSAALLLTFFGMAQLLGDPLNQAEWAALSARPPAPSMAQYFAFETFAGAFLHLIVLGVLMGLLLGVLGGAAGSLVGKIAGRSRT